MNAELRKLFECGYLGALDVRMAELISRLTGNGSPEAALGAALVSNMQKEGHVCIDLRLLGGKTISPAAIKLPEFESWREALAASAVVGTPGDFRPLILSGPRLYFYRYWRYENELAAILNSRISGFEKYDPGLLNRSLERFFPADAGGGTDWQKIAAAVSVLKRFCIISGGPGTGKTTTVARILAILIEQAGAAPLRIALCAPTGKAAARLQETILRERDRLDTSEKVKSNFPVETSTIHRLLGTISASPYFRHNRDNPIDADVVVIDEASMVDLALLSKLAQALRDDTRLILLGDRDQLASVEAGSVLGDLCDAGRTHVFSPGMQSLIESSSPLGGADGGEGDQILIRKGRKVSPKPGDTTPADCIVQLERNYRFGSASGIGRLSREVNLGNPEGALEILNTGPDDIRWRKLPPRQRLVSDLRDIVREKYSGYLKAAAPEEAFAAFEKFRILCAVREGPYGVENFNSLVERILEDEGLIHRRHRWYPGRPILVTRNDYGLRLFNGDVGIILPDGESGGELRAFFVSPGGDIRKLQPRILPGHETVFAMTVHKSQGSEFNEVLFVLPDRPLPILTRELIYTGLTRARESVELWAKEDVLAESIPRRIERTSGLRDLLWK